MAGNLAFAGNGASAPATNAGTITAGQGGFAALIGGTAANSGTINVPLGKVALGSGEQATLDLNGDGFMQVAAPTGAKTAQGQPLVGNSGRIAAPGGTVEMQAATVATAIRDAVNMSGVVQANSVSGHNGDVVLGGGPGGSVEVAGSIDVSGLRPGQTGGSAVVTGRSVNLAGTAHIDARGYSGGGTVEVGGAPHGQDPFVQNALTTNISAGAVIDASATNSGIGGTVAVWSDGTTTFDGSILATGGRNGGDGGWVETSGKGTLDVGALASVSAAAPKGTPGSRLLDPDSDIDITNTPPGGFTQITTCPGGTCSPTVDNSYIDPATIIASLNGGTSVTVTTSNPAGSQSGNILVGITAGGTDGQISGFISATPVTLTLNAGAGGGTGGITINSPISDSGSTGALSLVFNAGGTIVFDNTATIAGSLSATAGINGAGTISQTSAGILTANGASFTNSSSGGTITLTQDNDLSGTVTLGTTGSGANASLTNAASLTVGAANVGGNLTLTASGSGSTLSLAGLVQASDNTVTLNSAGAITQTGGITATNLVARTQLDAGAAITLNSTANAVSGNVTLSALNSAGTAAAAGPAGAITFLDTTGFTIAKADATSVGVVTSTTGTAILGAVGTIGEQTGAAIKALDLGVATASAGTGAAITLNQSGNTVAGEVNLSTLNATLTGPASGATGNILFVDSTGFTIVAAPHGQPAAATGIVTSTTGAANLQASGTITEQSGAVITAGALTGRLDRRGNADPGEPGRHLRKFLQQRRHAELHRCARADRREHHCGSRARDPDDDRQRLEPKPRRLGAGERPDRDPRFRRYDH